MFKQKSLKVSLFTVALLLALCLCGCAEADGQKSAATSAGLPESAVEESRAAASTVSGETAVEEEAFFTITDMGGTEVQIPYNIERVVDLWPSHNQSMLLLGTADKLVATASNVQKKEWYAQLYPRIMEMPGLNQGQLNLEEILLLEPDLVFVSQAAAAESLRGVGLNAVHVTFRDFAGLREMIMLTAQIFGEEAAARAGSYLAYLDRNTALVAERLQDIAEEDKPSVLHFGSAELDAVDLPGTMIDEWIKMAGGVNAAAQLSPGEDGKISSAVTAEQVLLLDPDIIIIGGDGAKAGYEKLTTDAAYSGMRAVENGEVYVNPQGTASWDRYSAEEALQILWAAKLFYSDIFADIDMTAEVCYFYENFFDYAMSAEEAELILNNESPAP